MTVSEQPVLPQTQGKLLGQTLEFTFNYAANKYGDVKTLYPSVFGEVENRLEAFSWLSDPLVKNAKPLIERLDDTLAPVVVQLQERAALASQKKESMMKSVQDQTDTVIKTVQDQKDTLYKNVYERVDPVYKNVQQRVDTNVVFASEKKNEFVVSLKTKWGVASKSTVDRLEKSLQNVQAFTSEKSKQYIHVDLIEYSKNILEQGKPAVQSIFESFGMLQSEKVASESSGQPSDGAQTSEETARLETLRLLLRQAMERARFVSTVAKQVPGYAYYVVAQSPEIASKVKDGMTKNSNNELYQGTMGTIGLLIASVRAVVAESITVVEEKSVQGLETASASATAEQAEAQQEDFPVAGSLETVGSL